MGASDRSRRVGQPCEDAQFLEWERHANWWRAHTEEKGIGDDETDRRSDQARLYEDLILTTASSGIVAARVKAEILLIQARLYLEEGCIPALESIVATLRGLS